MTGVLVVAACEGENLFTVAGNGGAPAGEDATAPTVAITTPRGDTVSGTGLADSVFVSVHLSDRDGVRSVKLRGVSLRGDAGLGTQEVIQRFQEKTVEFAVGVKDTTLTRYLLSNGDSIRERAYVIVEARDSAGNAAADTASLWVGGPTVELPGLVAGAVVSSGADLVATVKASDPRGVNRLTLDVTGAVQRQLVKALAAGAVDVQLDTAVSIPDTAAGPITLRATGRNTLGIVERSASVQLFVADRLAPTAAILLPRGDSLSAKPLGDSVLVTARVTDNFGVRSIRLLGVAERGNKDLGTDTVVPRFVERAITLPAGVKDTTISRYLRPTADSTRETAKILVVAADSSGNEATASVSLVLGGPDVAILDIAEGQTIQAGLGLAARVRAEDPLGITQIRIDITGAFDTSVVRTVNPASDSLVMDTVITIPVGTIGPMQVTATARNALNVAGQDGPITMQVIATGAVDSIPPVLQHTSTAPDRMETQDSVTIQVTGTDQGGGVAEVGYTVLGISPTRGDTLIRSGSVAFAPPRTGTVTQFFKYAAFNVDTLALPDTLVYEVTTWMKDAQGNCGASVGLDSLMALACDSLATGEIVALGRTGQRLIRSVVAGKTVLLPRGGRIMDAAVDTTAGRRRLFLSNIVTNRVDVFRLDEDRFEAAIGVGSEPWGLSVNRQGDSLWVANSGGTNLSVVHIDKAIGSVLAENDPTRLLTPDVNVFTAELSEGDAGAQWKLVGYPSAGENLSFSDRPQFLAVDAFGNVIYSTRTTAAGEGGTVRKGYFTPGAARPEVKLFTGYADVEETEDFWTIFHADNVTQLADATLVLSDHVSGFPSVTVSGSVDVTDMGTWVTAIDAMHTGGSDVEVWSGKVDVEEFLFKDTTFVTASGDGRWVLVGEGASAPLGRVMTYRAAQLDSVFLTSKGRVVDLLTNASEEVRGIGLNYDGTSGVVRGRFAAYFISPEDLRLQGMVEVPSASEGSGAALHPLNADMRTLDNAAGIYSPDTHLAFVGSGERTIEIIDTWRFTRVGRIYLRDTLVGPLRAVLPFASDNAGLTCGSVPIQDRYGNPIGNAVQVYQSGNFSQPLVDNSVTDDRCVVIKLFGVTSAGGVVVVNVRKSDVIREHPNRP